MNNEKTNGMETYNFVSKKLRDMGINHAIVNTGDNIYIYLPLLYYKDPGVIMITIDNNSSVITTTTMEDNVMLDILMGYREAIEAKDYNVFIPHSGVYGVYMFDYITPTNFTSVDHLIDVMEKHLAQGKIVGII